MKVESSGRRKGRQWKRMVMVVVEVARYSGGSQLTLQYSPLQECYGAFIPSSTYALCFLVGLHCQVCRRLVFIDCIRLSPTVEARRIIPDASPEQLRSFPPIVYQFQIRKCVTLAHKDLGDPRNQFAMQAPLQPTWLVASRRPALGKL